MKRSLSFAITLLIFCLLKEAKGDSDDSDDYDEDELSLFQDLFYNRKYDKRIRPVKNKSDPVNVILNVAYIQLIDLDDRSQTLKSSVWIRQSWKNEFLDWDPDDYGGITEITVDKGFLWVPDLVLYNTADDSGGNMDQFKTRIAINASGWHKWYAPAILKSGCKVDISYFPFDYQTCTLKFGSWTFLGPQLNLTSELKTADLNFFLKSSQFDLLSANAVRNVIIYTCCVEPYIDVTFHLTLKRQPGFYVFNLIVPSIVITFFALTVFAFPPQCGERMGLAFDCFLNISIISMMVSTMMPRDSETTPLLSTFMTMCMVEMTLSAAMNALCYRIERHTPMPNWVRQIVIQTIAPILGIEPCGTGITCPKFRCYGGVFEMSVRLRKRKDEENALPGEQKALTDRRPSVDFSQSSGYPRTSISEPECFSDFLFNSTSINPVLDEGCISKLDKEALLGLNTLVRRELHRMEEECTRDFWRCVSQILDRCLLLAFIFAWIFIVTLLFLSVPSNSTLE